jgi:hypothetical protein
MTFIEEHAIKKFRLTKKVMIQPRRVLGEKGV